MSGDAKRIRSPNYPQHGLPSAVSAIEKVWSKIHKHPAARDEILSAMGYKSYNGASAGVLSSLLKFGLLVKEGDDYKVTSLGRSVIQPMSEAEKAKALRDAAYRPQLFVELINHFDGSIPGNDDLIKRALLRKDFAPSAIPQAVQSFRETFELVEQTGTSYSSPETDDVEEEPEVLTEPRARHGEQASSAMPAPQTSHPRERVVFAQELGPEQVVRVVLSGDMDDRVLRTLRAFIDLHIELRSGTPKFDS
jgi:hypothetical protein